jgi:hypothetical protein
MPTEDTAPKSFVLKRSVGCENTQLISHPFERRHRSWRLNGSGIRPDSSG